MIETMGHPPLYTIEHCTTRRANRGARECSMAALKPQRASEVATPWWPRNTSVRSCIVAETPVVKHGEAIYETWSNKLEVPGIR